MLVAHVNDPAQHRAPQDGMCKVVHAVTPCSCSLQDARRVTALLQPNSSPVIGATGARFCKCALHVRLYTATDKDVTVALIHIHQRNVSLY
jgi:hypothetical protein